MLAAFPNPTRKRGILSSSLVNASGYEQSGQAAGFFVIEKTPAASALPLTNRKTSGE